jgi:hypothetical protein
MERRREKDDHGIGRMLAKVAGAIALAGAGALALSQLPTMRRYLRIRRMSAGKHPSPPNVGDQASRAQTPRWGTTHWPLH